MVVWLQKLWLWLHFTEVNGNVDLNITAWELWRKMSSVQPCLADCCAGTTGQWASVCFLLTGVELDRPPSIGQYCVWCEIQQALFNPKMIKRPCRALPAALKHKWVVLHVKSKQDWRVQNIQSNQLRTQQATSRDLVIALHHFQDYPFKGSGVINWDNPAMDEWNQERWIFKHKQSRQNSAEYKGQCMFSYPSYRLSFKDCRLRHSWQTEMARAVITRRRYQAAFLFPNSDTFYVRRELMYFCSLGWVYWFAFMMTWNRWRHLWPGLYFIKWLNAISWEVSRPRFTRWVQHLFFLPNRIL